MATYFVWADSPSPGSGFLTKDTGAHSLTVLVAGVTLASGDIIEVVKSASPIVETATQELQIPARIRSYGTNGTDRTTNKPTIVLPSPPTGQPTYWLSFGGNPPLYWCWN